LPEALQQTFVRRLAPEVKARMRTAILEVLRASRAQPGTYAEDAYSLEILVQRLGLDPTERAAIRDDNDLDLIRLAGPAATPRDREGMLDGHALSVSPAGTPTAVHVSLDQRGGADFWRSRRRGRRPVR